MNKVHIEFQRVQTWLFSVPRLRAMVGANTLLGEVLRVALRDLARQSGGWSLAPAAEDYPVAEPNDPLKDHDNPAVDARQGILARDGGHFDAVFSSGAEAFADAAATLLRRELPGLRFRVSVDKAQRDQASTVLSTELPVFAPCEWTGRGLASITVRQGNDRANVALDVSRRHEAARRAEGGKASDLASLLTTRTKLERLSRPSTFEALAGDGYLAVVHADGNGVGGAAGSDDVARADFFHRNRVLLRRALQVAVDQACEKAETAPPLLPLMLGGDDLLLLCHATVALPFVVDLCAELERLQADRGEAFHLTLGVGVVFSRPKIPFHRLHEVAENLAASAKRRYRGFSESERTSVVDWAVYTTAWIDDPADVRRRDWVRGSAEEPRVLSRRPMPVLGTGLGCLEGLAQAAVAVAYAPRSQLRYLVDQLPRGKALSELAFEELSKDARESLEQAGVSQAWIRLAGAGPYVTSVLDLVEVAEIGRLGRAGTVSVGEEVIEEYDDELEVAHVQA